MVLGGLLASIFNTNLNDGFRATRQYFKTTQGGATANKFALNIATTVKRMGGGQQVSQTTERPYDLGVVIGVIRDCLEKRQNKPPFNPAKRLTSNVQDRGDAYVVTDAGCRNRQRRPSWTVPK